MKLKISNSNGFPNDEEVNIVVKSSASWFFLQGELKMQNIRWILIKKGGHCTVLDNGIGSSPNFVVSQCCCSVIHIELKFERTLMNEPSIQYRMWFNKRNDKKNGRTKFKWKVGQLTRFQLLSPIWIFYRPPCGGTDQRGQKNSRPLPAFALSTLLHILTYVDKMRFIFFGSVLLKQIAAQFRRTRRRKMILLFLLFPEKLTNMVLKRCVAFRWNNNRCIYDPPWCASHWIWIKPVKYLNHTHTHTTVFSYIYI